MLRPFSRFCVTIGAIPRSIIESLSYEEQLFAFYKFLKDKLVPAVEGNTTAIKAVEEWFENLDVQEEINNKLDKMAEDGSLTELIKNYVDPLYQTYQASINQRLDAQDIDINNQNTAITVQNNKISVIETQIGGLVNNNPTPVNSVDDMTDTTKIYVNTTDGNWYYYNGDSWTVGGVYQSTGISESDKVIVKINNTIDDIKTIEDIIDINLFEKGTWEQGSISSSNGSNQTSTTRLRTGFNKADINKNMVLNVASGYKARLFKYSTASTSSYIEGTGWLEGINNIEVEDVYYRLLLAKSDDETIVPAEYTNVLLSQLEKAIDEKNNLESKLKFTTSYQSGGYAGDICFVGKYLIAFESVADSHLQSLAGSGYIINEKENKAKLAFRISTNFGHCNTMTYDPIHDALLFGNGSTDFNQSGHMYVYNNFLQTIEEKIQTSTASRTNVVQIDFTIADAIDIDCSSYEFGSEPKFNLIYAYSDDSAPVAYLITKNHKTVRKLVMGLGSSSLTYGTLNTVNDNEYNGTFNIIETINYPDGTIDTDNTYPVQGGAYINGAIITGVGHNQFKMYKKYMLSSEKTTKEYLKLIYNSNGTEKNLQIQGLTFSDKYMYVLLGDYIHMIDIPYFE